MVARKEVTTLTKVWSNHYFFTIYFGYEKEAAGVRSPLLWKTSSRLGSGDKERNRSDNRYMVL